MVTKPSFEQVQCFFRSYGLEPQSNDNYIIQHNYLNERLVRSYVTPAKSVNEMCYGRMKVEAISLFGKEFLDFVIREMNSIYSSFYLDATSWEQFRESWEGFNKQVPVLESGT